MRLPLPALVLLALCACASAPKPVAETPPAPARPAPQEDTTKLVVEHVRVDDDDGSFESQVDSDEFVRFLGQLVLSLGAAMRGEPVERGSEFLVHATLYADRGHDVTLDANHPVSEQMRAAFLARAKALDTVHPPKSPVRIEVAVRLPGDPPPAVQPRTGTPWGDVVDDPAEQQRVFEAISALGESGAAARAHFADAVFVGPALWAQLLAADPSLAQVGVPSKNVQATNLSVASEMRSFWKPADVERLLSSSAMRALGKRFSQGTARAATAGERQSFYANIPFEIADAALPVIAAGTTALVASMTEGRVFWLDLVPAAK